MSSPLSSDPLKTFVTQRSGDAFRVLVEAHAGVVTGVAHRITGSHETAEEVTQDVFTLLARRAPALAKGEAPLPAWLHRTATYMALNARKREKRRNLMLEKAMHELPQTTEPSADAPEWLPHLDAALNSLNVPDRQLLLLHHAAGYTLTEAAAQLGLSVEAVKKRSQRAMDRLRSLMSRIRSGVEGPHGPQGPPMTDSRIPVTACLAAAFTTTLTVSSARASAIAVNVLTASKTAGPGAVLLNILHTMNYTKAAAAIAACLALGNLGWQEYEMTTTRRDVETLRREVAANAKKEPSAAVVSAPAQKAAPDIKPAPRLEFAELAEMFTAIETRRSLSAMARLSSTMDSMREEDALRLLETSLTATVAPSARDKMREALLSCLARTDPARAVAMSMKFWETASGNQAAEIIFHTGDHFTAWLKKDAPAALKWLEESDRSSVLASRGVNGASPQRIMRGAALRLLAETAPDQARTLLDSLPPEEKTSALNHAAGRMERAENWKPMLALMMTLTPDERADSVAHLAGRAGMQSKEALLELTGQAGLSPAGTAAALASGLSESGRKEPLADSLAWLAGHAPAGAAGIAQVQYLMQGGMWYHAAESIPAVADFFRRGELTERQVATFTQNAIRTVGAESGDVLQMAAALTDPALRREATSGVVTAWAGRNAAEAAAAVQTLTISPGEKSALLKDAAR